MTDTITLTVDGIDVTVPRGATVMDACKVAEKEIPYFCYHKRLSIAGNCRMCLVEVEGAPKPVASCHWPAGEGMVVKTNSDVTIEARKGTMEMLLVNHPLDCPICDQGGECDLQDQAVAYGSDRTRFHEAKRAVDDKNIGAKIKTVMTRCIHCMRCVRFATEVAGIEEFGATGRGQNMQVGTYVEEALQSNLAGNMIDLCPVGALTNKPYAFTARPWELKGTETIDVMDAMGAHVRVDARADKVMRIVPRECDHINEEWMTDAGRFSFDALNTNRLTAPFIRKGKGLKSASWQEAFNGIKTKLKKAKKTNVAALAGDMHCAEDLYSFKAFMKDVVGTDNIDARSDGSIIDGRNPSSYMMNTSFEDFAKVDALLLVGCNPALEMPLLNARIHKQVMAGTMKIASIGAPMDLTYGYDVLPNAGKTLKAVIDGKEQFAKVLKKAKNPAILIGAKAALGRSDGLHILHQCAVLAEKYDMVRDDWNGFNVLQQSSGRICALDMGVYPQVGGMTTHEIVAAAKGKKLDILFVYGDVDVPAEQLKNTKTIVYIGTHMTDMAKQADIVLPSAAHTEKQGLWANNEGRVQEAHAAVKPPLHAKEDWKIFRALSEVIGKTLPFDTLKQVRKCVVEQCAAYSEVGNIVPLDWEKPGLAGTVKAELFQNPVPHYYLNNALLRQSDMMKRCQVEMDSIINQKLKKVS